MGKVAEIEVTPGFYEANWTGYSCLYFLPSYMDQLSLVP
jgi:hypothetical protein